MATATTGQEEIANRLIQTIQRLRPPINAPVPDHCVLVYTLTKTTNRLTFDIVAQRDDTVYQGEDDGEYFHFIATNGYEVISRSRMDIQTERLWLLGAKSRAEQRSGTMVFSSNEKRDIAFDRFVEALDQWASSYDGIAIRQPTE